MTINKKSPTKNISPKNKRGQKDDKIIKEKEKEIFVSDMKKTLKDVGRLPALLLAPVVAYVSKKYDKIPSDRRKKLEKIVQEMKNKGGNAIEKLKDWFQGMLRHDAHNKKNTKKTSGTRRKDGIFSQLKNDVNEKIKKGKKTLNKTEKTVTKKTKTISKTTHKNILKSKKTTNKTNTKRPRTNKTTNKTNTKRPRTNKTKKTTSKTNTKK